MENPVSGHICLTLLYGAPSVYDAFYPDHVETVKRNAFVDAIFPVKICLDISSRNEAVFQAVLDGDFKPLAGVCTP